MCHRGPCSLLSGLDLPVKVATKEKSKKLTGEMKRTLSTERIPCTEMLKVNVSVQPLLQNVNNFCVCVKFATILTQSILPRSM